MTYMQHMAVTLQRSPSGFHRWGRSPGGPKFFPWTPEPHHFVVSSPNTLLLQSLEPSKRLLRSPQPQILQFGHSSTQCFVCCWRGIGTEDVCIPNQDSSQDLVSLAAVIRVVTQCSSPLTAAHSSSAFLSLN